MFICIHMNTYNGNHIGEGKSLDEAFEDCKSSLGAALDIGDCTFHIISEPLQVKQTIHEVPL